MIEKLRMFFMARRVREPAQYTGLSRFREIGQSRQDKLTIERVFAQDMTVEFDHGHTGIVGFSPIVAAVNIENSHVGQPPNQFQ
jgi:hypothetical protein